MTRKIGEGEAPVYLAVNDSDSDEYVVGYLKRSAVGSSHHHTRIPREYRHNPTGSGDTRTLVAVAWKSSLHSEGAWRAYYAPSTDAIGEDSTFFEWKVYVKGRRVGDWIDLDVPLRTTLERATQNSSFVWIHEDLPYEADDINPSELTAPAPNGTHRGEDALVRHLRNARDLLDAPAWTDDKGEDYLRGFEAGIHKVADEAGVEDDLLDAINYAVKRIDRGDDA